MKLLILDRDGTLNRSRDDYVASADEWEALPGALEAAAKPFGALLADQLLHVASEAFNGWLDKQADPKEARVQFGFNKTKLEEFIYDRLGGNLREQGASAQEVDAVLALRPQRLADVTQRLQAVRAFAALPEAPALAAANKRIGNILKKSEDEGAAVNTALFVEPAEKDLYAAMQATVPAANAKFDAGDHTASLQALAALRTPVDAFFDGVMVNADDPALKANRLGLLKSLHDAMNRVADLSRLAA